MPLSNDKEKFWTGWLVDGLGGRESEVTAYLAQALADCQIPKSTVKTGTVNMWWRKDSRYVDVTSTMDGTITATIHVQEYGTSLWIGRAAESYRQGNYYKRMASAAFLEVVDRTIVEALAATAAGARIQPVKDEAPNA